MVVALKVGDAVLGARWAAGPGCVSHSAAVSRVYRGRSRTEQILREPQLYGGKDLVDVKGQRSELGDWFERQRELKYPAAPANVSRRTSLDTHKHTEVTLVRLSANLLQLTIICTVYKLQRW